MKVKMLEELVSRIDGKPASGAPLFLGGGGEGGGRLTRLSWDPPHPLLRLLLGYLGLLGPEPFPCPL